MKNLSLPNRPISDLEFVVYNERQREGGAGADGVGEPPGVGGRQDGGHAIPRRAVKLFYSTCRCLSALFRTV